LKESTLAIGDAHLPIYHVLQHLSTLIGITVLATTYYFWLRRQGITSIFLFAREDGWRYACLIGVGLVSLAVALPLAANAAAGFDGYLSTRVFIFRGAIYGAASFALLLPMVAILAYAMRKRLE
jgi:hypothetical protein